tara:strand:- start:257 stop:547 length:291 start_codon:yes stop_codon:yes gene_type:complete
MSSYKKQIGGSHYKNMKIQPSKFINDNKLLFAEGNAIKYICRHAAKNGKEDLEKAKHYIDMIIERDYPTTPIKDEKPPETSHADWIKGYKEWKKNK